MIFSTKKIIFISAVSLGIGGLGFWTVDEYSKKTISENLNGVKLVFDSGEVVKDGTWAKVFSKLDKNIESKTEKFKEISNLLKERIDLDDKDYSEEAKKLKQACESSRYEKYSSLFTRNDDLIHDVEKFCSIKIGQILSSHGLLTFSNDFSNIPQLEKSQLINLLYSLLTHENEELDSKLLSLKSSLFFPRSSTEFSPSEKNKQILFNWCKDNVGDYYLNDSDSRIPLIKKYCTTVFKIPRG